MTNFEKYKTAKERTKAFERSCTLLTDCEKCPCYKQKGYSKCEFIWLDLEAEKEKPLPCPFCGENTEIGRCKIDPDVYYVTCSRCEYRTSEYCSESYAIAGHNRVAKAVMDAKAKEANDDAYTV